MRGILLLLVLLLPPLIQASVSARYENLKMKDNATATIRDLTFDTKATINHEIKRYSNSQINFRVQETIGRNIRVVLSRIYDIVDFVPYSVDKIKFLSLIHI